jgi:hypothetical protein
MYYRIFCLAAFFLSVFSGTAPAAGTPSLPEISGWRSGEIVSAPLDAPDENYGRFEMRDYVTPDGARLKAALTYGSGPKFFNQPSKGASGGDAKFGPAGTYEIISVMGYKTTLESDPILGFSAAINAFDKKYTLTIECGPYETRSDLIRWAEILIGEIEKGGDD